MIKHCWNTQAKVAIENGFNLVPLVYAQKFPSQKNWTSIRLKTTDIDLLDKGGFGILCGIGEYSVYALDVDVKEQNIADEFSSNFEFMHGNPLIRIGQKPKILIPFRMIEAGNKKKKSTTSPQGHIDILGYGQQFVAYNIHPDTQQEYTWTTAPHKEKAKDLPLLSESDVDYWFEFFKSLVTIPEKKITRTVKHWESNNNRTYTNREIKAFLSCFGEEFYNGSHDEWIPIVMAVHHETRGSNKGKEMARNWSKQGSTYNEENFNYKWDTFDFEEIGNEDKKRSTFASLFYHHRNLIPDGLLCYRFTDAYNASLFSTTTKGYFLYAESLGGWFVRHGHLWKALCEDTKESMIGIVARFLASCKDDANDLEDVHKEKKEEARKTARSKGISVNKSPRDTFKTSFLNEKVENRAKAKSTTLSLEDSSSFRISANKIGCDERYLGDTDAIVDLETGQKVPYNPKLIITKSTGTPFVEGDPSTEFLNVVSGYFANEELMNFFVRCIGMALYGGNEAPQILVNLLGVGGSAKSTLMKLLQHAFGMQYISHLQFKDVMSAYEGDAGTPNPNIINAFGSRIAVINETNEHASINEAMVKAITGGDTIASRLLHSNKIIRKKASFTPFIVTNKPLFIRSTDNSIWRRIVIIPFDKKIEKFDPTLESKLKTYSLEAKKWFMQGVRDYIQKGHDLSIPQECLDVTAKARRDLDSYQMFIEDCCDVGESFWEEKKLVAQRYTEYLREEMNYSQKNVPTPTVVRNLEIKGFKESRQWERHRPNRGKCLYVMRGLRLKPRFEEINEENDNIIAFKGK